MYVCIVGKDNRYFIQSEINQISCAMVCYLVFKLFLIEYAMFWYYCSFIVHF